MHRYRSALRPNPGQGSVEFLVVALAVAAVVALVAHSPLGRLMASLFARHASFAFALSLP